MRHLSVPEGACCEVCGQSDPNLLEIYNLGTWRRRAPTILCCHHAAPVASGLPSGSGRARFPSRSQLFAFWEDRRPGIIWMSPERRLLRDRRDRARFAGRERRRPSC
jgi:hypothetical protein